jgi:uncharacterized membrane protein (Fun14 family)
MVDISLSQLGLEVGGSAVIGGLIGFAAKKVANLIAVIVGLELLLFRYLESRGILSVDWERLTAGIVKASERGQEQGVSWLTTLISTAGVGVGFTGGFLLGFKRA